MSIADRIVVAVCADCGAMLAVTRAAKPRQAMPKTHPKGATACPVCKKGAIVWVRYQLVARAVPAAPRTVGKPRAQG